MVFKEYPSMEYIDSLLEKALRLKPRDRFMLIEELIHSLDQPDKEIDKAWVEEAERRLAAHREGRTRGIPLKEVFEEES